MWKLKRRNIKKIKRINKKWRKIIKWKWDFKKNIGKNKRGEYKLKRRKKNTLKRK